MKSNEKILITGCAGFIGHHVMCRLMESGIDVVGIDSLDEYYSVELKLDRLKEQGFELGQYSDGVVSVINSKFERAEFYKVDICDLSNLRTIFERFQFSKVIHLAAQPGVRYSLEHPQKYIDTNITGFLNILEISRLNNIEHLIYASSSSVYGLNRKLPLSERDTADHPISMYGVSKRTNELMAHMYSHVYDLPTTGLRFFTVYGPWARPDMALFSFADKIYHNQPITVFNHGKMTRDFTYVSDIVDAIVLIVDEIPRSTFIDQGNINNSNFLPNESIAPFRILNIGSNNPIELHKYIELIEKYLDKKAIIHYEMLQAGDLTDTHADLAEINKIIDYQSNVSIEQGIQNFCDWFKNWKLFQTN